MAFELVQWLLLGLILLVLILNNVKLAKLSSEVEGAGLMIWGARERMSGPAAQEQEKGEQT